MIGQTIDERYQIEALIGRGGMGAVYRSNDLIEDRLVAIKVLHYFLDTQTDVALTRFQREFRVLAQLDHPRIVRAFGYGMYQNMPYLVLEFLSGQTLAQELSNGLIPWPRLLPIARQICEALVYLHDQSIIHRDLKPGNLMIQNHGDPQVKLMDFGLVRPANFSQHLTQEGVALGTVSYMAPEQAQGFPVDFRADLYALGVILYEMVTGRPPFIHDNPAMVLMQQITSSPLAPSQFNANIDESLEQLILQLLAKEPAQRPSTDEVVATLALLADDAPPAMSRSKPKRVDLIPRVPLIGREQALAEVWQVWSQAQSSRGQTVLVEGAAGIGKTRLLDEAAAQVRLTGGSIVRDHCREYGSLPYYPLIDMVATTLDSLLTVRPSLPVELSRLLPGASDSIETSTAGDQAEARLRIFMGCWTVFREAGQSQPLMIVVEDIQWANSATLELLGYLAERIESSPILLVMTYRSEEIEAHSPLAQLQQELWRRNQAKVIRLEALRPEQVKDFLKMALGQAQVPPLVVDSFYETTNGNPFFIEETLKALAAEGQVEQWINQPSSQSGHYTGLALPLPLPQNVLVLAERRLALLSVEDRPILTTAAVLGSEFSFSLLQMVAQLDEDDLLDAIDRLLAARLIEELPLQAGEDRYRFSQEALRQALLNTLSQRRKRQLHKRTGNAMQNLIDTSRPQTWPILAYHFTQAGEYNQALNYCLQAGHAAAKAYANAEAVTHYRHALTIIEISDRVNSIGEEQLRDLYINLGRNLEMAGKYDEALQIYQALEALSRERSSQPLELAASLAQATIRATSTPVNDQTQGEALSQRALALAQKLNDPQAEAKAYWNLLLLFKDTERFQEALDCAHQAITICRQYGLPEQMAYVFNDMAWVYLGLGRTDDIDTSLEQARTLWRQLNNKPMLADNLSVSASQKYFRGNFQGAFELAEEAYQISQSIDNFWNLANSQWVMAHVYMEYGEFGRAVEVLEATIQLSDEAGWVFGQVTTRADLGLVFGLMGDIERGLDAVRSAQVRAETFPNDSRLYAMGVTAQLYILAGDVAGAEKILEESALLLNPDNASNFALVWITLAEARVLRIQGHYQQALATIDHFVGLLDRLKFQAFKADALWIKGRILADLDHVDEAIDMLAQARHLAETLGSRYTLLMILETLYRVEAQRGHVIPAADVRREARPLVDHIADGLPADLRPFFLDLPDIKAILTD
ncbi:MAG: protein kinase [Anaerolineae bacterium]|nr:protein kinase [Anaerolineae bacterium]